MKGNGRLRIGTSGYEYEHWKGIFYPEGLPNKRRFAHYAQHFDTVEINNTFYRLPNTKTFSSWNAQAPEGFCYAVKFSRFGTHVKRLKEPKGPVDLFLERSRPLHGLMGPILVQLPPTFRFDPKRLDAFLSIAPRNHRWALEFRHESWLCRATYEILRAHNAALVIHDLIPTHPRVTTATWHYQRFHGGPGEAYSRQLLVSEARRLREHLSAGRDVYVYFNNDEGGHAVKDALDLRGFVERSHRRSVSRRPCSDAKPRPPLN